MSNVRTNAWIGLFVLAVFFLGLAVGVIATPWFGLGPPMGRISAPGRPGAQGPPPMTERLIERLSRSIELTEDQTARLSALFDVRRDRAREIGRSMRERFDRERETFGTALREILTAEQMDQFESEIVRLNEKRGRLDGRPERDQIPRP
jgi:Spy/CpxP family protein refolding chaperone